MVTSQAIMVAEKQRHCEREENVMASDKDFFFFHFHDAEQSKIRSTFISALAFIG